MDASFCLSRNTGSLSAEASMAGAPTRVTTDENAYLNNSITVSVNQLTDRRLGPCSENCLPKKTLLLPSAPIGIQNHRSSLGAVAIATTDGPAQGESRRMFRALRTSRPTQFSTGMNKDPETLGVSSCKRSWRSLGSDSGDNFESITSWQRRSPSSSALRTKERQGQVVAAFKVESTSAIKKLPLFSFESANVATPSLTAVERQISQLPAHSRQETSRLSSVAIATTVDQVESMSLSSLSFHNVEAIRKSVRDYTQMPKHARPLDCEPVLAIYALTGYVVVSPATSLSPSSSTKMNNAAQGTWDSPHVKVKPGTREAADPRNPGDEDGFRKLNACKLSDASLALQATQCCPEKDRGFYRYVHVPTNSVVTPQVYEERYMRMLSETCAVKEHYWRHYFDHLKHLECAQNLNVVLDTFPSALFLSGPRNRAEKIRVKSRKYRRKVLSQGLDDEVSSDPEVAAAEDELHERIDAALSEYSHKMIVIQDRRRRILERASYEASTCKAHS